MMVDIRERSYYRTSSHPNYAADSVMVTGSCGHQQHYKGSKEPKRRFDCKECDREKARDGNGAETTV